MAQIVGFHLPSGGAVYVEVAGKARGATKVPAGAVTDKIIEAQVAFDQAMERVRDTAAAMMDKLTTLPRKPDEVAVEFGINLDAKLGAIVASAGLEANFKVSLKWTATGGE